MMKLTLFTLCILHTATATTPELDKILLEQKTVELPNVFRDTAGALPCHSNGVVQGWCHQQTESACAILPNFNEYGCLCAQEHTACPMECVEGSELIEKTRNSIRCKGIPKDEPNYILKETHQRNHCENNAVVSGWCDDYINPHLECRLQTHENSYECHCSKANACPLECIDAGSQPIERTSTSIKCGNIPLDQPNYDVVVI